MVTCTRDLRDVPVLPPGSVHRIENTPATERLSTDTIMADDGGGLMQVKMSPDRAPDPNAGPLLHLPDCATPLSRRCHFGSPVRARPTVSIVSRRCAAPFAAFRPRQVVGAAPGVGHRPCEPSAATDRRPPSAARSSRGRLPLPFALPSHPAGQPGDAPGVPPTAATRREAIRRQGPAATPEPVPPRFAARETALPQQESHPHRTSRPARVGHRELQQADCGQEQEPVHGQRPQRSATVSAPACSANSR